ncbi:hypothetical protein PF008_g24303 [Phytophthora fragariae]|uniref:Uncharacterized protein n=1 Tax=Phytophthora fragariae TaxID=53985 RepID=A0A6G0QP43_9STRA|nr:hypothetical protein PF008_g24303 [Phytophthora fragariae]
MFNMVVYGDFGPSDQSRNTFVYGNSLSSDKVDLIYHIGDVGYADDDFLPTNNVIPANLSRHLLRLHVLCFSDFMPSLRTGYIGTCEGNWTIVKRGGDTHKTYPNPNILSNMEVTLHLVGESLCLSLIQEKAGANGSRGRERRSGHTGYAKTAKTGTCPRQLIAPSWCRHSYAPS